MRENGEETRAMKEMERDIKERQREDEYERGSSRLVLSTRLRGQGVRTGAPKLYRLREGLLAQWGFATSGKSSYP